MAAAHASAPRISTPPTSVGEWVDLGHYLAPWLAGDAPVPVTGVSAPTRVAGLRRDDGHWLAIVLVQATAAHAPCPRPDSLHLSSPHADSCLRMRRDADFEQWLAQQHSVLHRWLQGQGFGSQPRTWVGYRAPASGGGTVEAHALIHPALIEPATRNNIDFLAGGQPGERWARDFAAATRASSATTALAVPAWPFGPHVAPPVPAAPAVAPPPQATQVTPRPPAPTPRADRQ